VGADGVAVVTTDVLVDRVHFDLADCTPEAAARKALAVNLSDLAAAAAHPVGFLVGVVLPRPPDRGVFDGLAQGFADAARELRCPCLGGDTNVADGALALSVTALGRSGPRGVLSRSGAQVGDELSVTGPLGGSRQGRHLTFRPRVDEALRLAAADVPHAMMDLSDGLSRDLPRLCRASGVGARIEADALPVHPDARSAPGSKTPLDRALHDGEDFELLVAHAPLDEAARRALAKDGVQMIRIGEVRPEGDGVRLVGDGRAEPLEPRGWDHIAR
jgi:thiamine-monophosphate kinase